MEHSVQGGEMRVEVVAYELRELREHEQRALLEARGIGAHALEHEGQELWPLTVFHDGGRKLGNGVAELLDDGLSLLPLDADEEVGLDGGLRGWCQSWPYVCLVACDLLPQENRGHGPDFYLPA